MKPQLILLLLLILAACSPPQDYELVIYGGPIYTADEQNPTAEAVAVKNGRIAFVGKATEAKSFIGPQTAVLDLKGKTMTPGFIESHAHLMGIGHLKSELDLTATQSYEEIVAMVAEATENTPKGEWITGRGWHQSKWENKPAVTYKGFQTHHDLSAVSPDHPVYLRHASGHAGFANAKAMELSGVGAETPFNERGEVVKDAEGNPTGIFNERAMGLVTRHIPDDSPEANTKALELAIQECLENGITSFQDAGENQATLDLYQQFLDEGKLGIRLWVMLSGRDKSLLGDWYQKGPQIDDWITIRSIKLYSDGALGSRGAWLLAPYTDRPDHTGHETQAMTEIGAVAKNGLTHGFQVCVHAIGDRANREVLDQYETAFTANPDSAKDHRFRIEHAQHIHRDDIPRFAQLGVIASMQGIHMASDRPWAINRLGIDRIKEGAYVWQKLLQSGAKVINGTDAPVEPVNPIPSFYASVARKTLKGTPEGGFEPDQKMTRQQALTSYTLDAAFGAFEENQKGSIEVGKFADFTIFDQDLMTVPEDKILETTVSYTVVGGEIKYQKEK